MTTTLRDQALQEFQELTQKQISELELRLYYSDMFKDVSSLASDIWQALDKATNLCLVLWSLKLEEEASNLEDWKIHLTKMHRQLADRD